MQPSNRRQFIFKPSIFRTIEESKLNSYLSSVRSPVLGEESSKVKVSFNNSNSHLKMFKHQNLINFILKKMTGISNNNSRIMTSWISTSKDNQMDGKFLSQLKNLKTNNIKRKKFNKSK